MRTGTKSLLFGVHNVIWHPLTVTLAWKKLYKKWPTAEELVCIIIHDWGYWGCENMDDEKGQQHPNFGAILIHRLFNNYDLLLLCLYHSRHLAKAYGEDPSKLCWADKLSITYDPCWLYLHRARLSGEIIEYRKNAAASGFCPLSVSDKEWYFKISKCFREQALNQKSGDLYMMTTQTAKH